MSQVPDRIDVDKAERLRVEGNELFRRGEYLAAVQKLTEALDNNPTDAALHANCAEISTAISEYLDVSWDGEESAELKAAYTKARARRAAASHGSSACVELLRGLEFLSSLDELTPGQRARKANFEEDFRKVNAARATVESNQVVISDDLLRSAELENQLFRGWVESEGPTSIKKEAPERLEAEGWNSVRAALDVTIRIWIFTAWHRSQHLGHFDLSRKMFMNALEVLEWGRNQWPDIPMKDRGFIFERRFIRSVKTIFLETMQESVYRYGPTEFTYEELIQLAEDIVNGVNSDTVSTLPSDMLLHSLAYWLYPKGTALSVLGWTYLQKAIHSSPGDLQRTPTIRKASQYYLSAAKSFPEDEESHVRCLVKALECMCTTGTVPLKQTLSLCKTVRDAFDQAIEIWGAPPYGDTLRELLERVKEFEDKYRRLILEGKCTLDTISGRLPEARG
ncbi:hypothetical protein H1R20_g9810, partial [Candolleomyces eurysporus]